MYLRVAAGVVTRSSQWHSSKGRRTSVRNRHLKKVWRDSSVSLLKTLCGLCGPFCLRRHVQELVPYELQKGTTSWTCPGDRRVQIYGGPSNALDFRFNMKGLDLLMFPLIRVPSMYNSYIGRKGSRKVSSRSEEIRDPIYRKITTVFVSGG